MKDSKIYPTALNLGAEFKKYNDLYFGGEIPTIPVTPAKLPIDRRGNMQRITYGCFTHWDATSQKKAGYIEIALIERPEQKIIETLIHEMIHAYIYFKGIADNGSHGIKFREIAARISNKGAHSIPLPATFD